MFTEKLWLPVTKIAEINKSSATLQGEEVRSLQINTRSTLRVLALFETATVSGPAKNLFQFCRAARILTPIPSISVDVEIVTFERTLGCSGGGDFAETAQQSNLPLHCIPEKFLGDLRILSHLQRLKERVKPDLIETHAVKSHALLRASGLWRKTPWIAFHHGYTNTSFRSPLYNSLDRWSLKVAARVVTMNHVFAQKLVLSGICAKHITVLHNAVQLPADSQLREEAGVRERRKGDLGISPEEKVILCVGRLSREKAQIDMVATLQRLQQIRSGRRTCLLLVGDGPERSRISRTVKAAGLTERVRFVGQLSDVSPFYRVADVVAIPSLSEGSPNVLLEAMAFGVPVVATSVGGIPEIVTHEENALLVPVHSPQAMAEAIDRLLSNPVIAACQATQAQKTVRTDYSPEGRADSLLRIYSDVYRSSVGRLRLLENAPSEGPLNDR